ncbi:hypothetical protein X975_13685, partial [Stegodyphus mimosarum]
MIFEFYDPQNKSCGQEYQILIHTWCEVLAKIFATSTKWKIICPSHILQTDNMSCGVLVCYYAYQRVQNESLNTPVNITEFRKLIYEHIISSN